MRDTSFSRSMAGNPGYLSPQLFQACWRGSEYNPFKADVFALGATLWELILLAQPTVLGNHEDLERTVNMEVEVLSCSELLKSLLLSILAMREEDRPSMKEICCSVDVTPLFAQPNTSKWKDLRTSICTQTSEYNSAYCDPLGMCTGLRTRVDVSEADIPVLEIVGEAKTLKEVDTIFKSAIYMSKSSDMFKELTIKCSVMTKDCFTVTRQVKGYDYFAEKRVLEVDDMLQFQQMENYFEMAHLYENLDSYVPVTVFGAISSILQRHVAVKSYGAGIYGINYILREARLQAKVESKHVCKLLDCYIRKGSRSQFEMGLVMELLELDLKQDICERSTKTDTAHAFYSETKLWQILADVVDALLFAKLQGVAHRDVKPSHIFWNGYLYKLGDFGSAIEVRQKEVFPNGTSNYLSPEMRTKMMGGQIEIDPFQSDVYSLGVSLLHLAKLQLPNSLAYSWRDSNALNQAVEEEIRDLPYTHYFCALVKQMLMMDPYERPSFEALRLAAITHCPDNYINKYCDYEFPANSPLFKETTDDLKARLSVLADAWIQIANGSYLQAEIILLTSSMQESRSLANRQAQSYVLAYFYLRQNRYRESICVLEDIVLKELNDATANVERTIRMSYILNRTYVLRGRWLEVQSLLKSVLEKTPQRSEITACFLDLLGDTYRRQGRQREAEKTLAEALTIYTELYQKNYEQYIGPLIHQGRVFTEAGRFAEAETLCGNCLDALEKSYIQPHPRRAEVLSAMGDIYYGQGRVPEAIIVHTKAHKTLVSQFGEQNPLVIECYNCLGCDYFEAGDISQATTIHEKCLESFFKLGGEEHPYAAVLMINIARDYLAALKICEAKELITQATNQLTLKFGKDSPLTIQSCIVLGQIYQEEGKLKEAGELFAKSLALCQTYLDENHPKTIACSIHLASVYYQEESKLPDAELLCLNAYRSCLEVYGEKHAETVAVLGSLAAVYTKEGKLRDAEYLHQIIRNLQS